MLVVVFCFWAALGFPGYVGFTRLRPPPQTTVNYVDSNGGLEKLGLDMVQGLASGNPEARGQGRRILHSLLLSQQEMGALLGSQLANEVYPLYARGMAQFMRDSEPRWRELVSKTKGEMSAEADTLMHASRFADVRPGDMDLYKISTNEVYRLNLTLGTSEKALTVQLSNMVYVNGIWRMLGPWISEFLYKRLPHPTPTP